MNFVLMYFGAGVAQLRIVAIFLLNLVYHPQIKFREQSALGLKREL